MIVQDEANVSDYHKAARKALCMHCAVGTPRTKLIAWWHGDRSCDAGEPELSRVTAATEAEQRGRREERARCVAMVRKGALVPFSVAARQTMLDLADRMEADDE